MLKTWNMKFLTSQSHLELMLNLLVMELMVVINSPLLMIQLQQRRNQHLSQKTTNGLQLTEDQKTWLNYLCNSRVSLPSMRSAQLNSLAHLNMRQFPSLLTSSAANLFSSLAQKLARAAKQDICISRSFSLSDVLGTIILYFIQSLHSLS